MGVASMSCDQPESGAASVRSVMLASGGIADGDEEVLALVTP